MKQRERSASGLILALVLAVPMATWAQTYDAYYRYRGDYPYDEAPASHNKPDGITSDGSYWYISAFGTAQSFWKIPIGFDLADEAEDGVAGVTERRISDFPGIVSLGYTQWGGPVHCDVGGDGYLAKMLSGSSQTTDSVGFFSASNMAFLTHCTLSHDPELFGYTLPPPNAAGYPAIQPRKTISVDPVGALSGGYPRAQPYKTISVDPVGFLYVLRKAVLHKYELSWDELKSQGSITATYLEEITLLNPDGTPFDDWPHRGDPDRSWSTHWPVFSEGGGLLYLVASTWLIEDRDQHSICAFDTESWREVARSSTDTNDLFFFDVWTGQGESSQGLTVVDLDDGRAPVRFGTEGCKC